MMITFFLDLLTNLALISGAATPGQPRHDGRILGGRPVDIADFPYQVKL